MYIKRAKIENFGKFHQKTIHFTPGLNVVYGANEAGKSTLQSFLVGMLFGMEKQRGRGSQSGEYQHYEPWNTASFYSGSMDFVVADKEFAVERNFYHKEKTARLYNRQDREELSVEHGDLEILLGGVNKRIYENTCCISQAAVVTEAEFARELQQELMNHAQGGDVGVDIRRAEQILEQNRRRTEQLLKKLQQQKGQQLQRLEWEQERLKQEVFLLEQKVQEAKCKTDGEEMSTEQPEVSVSEEVEDAKGVWWHIPVIGWILRFFQRIRRLMQGKRRSTESFQEEKDTDEPEQMRGMDRAVRQILLEQLEEKRIRQCNLQEEMEELTGITREERELQIRHKSIQLAIDTLSRVAGEGYQENKDELIGSVSEILSAITDGKYDRLEIAEDGNVFVYSDNRKLEPWQLSRGTMEQLYLAIRLGAGRCIMKEEQMPILLDETFGSYDDLRLQRTLQWLAKQPEQVILFTCQRRELIQLEEMGIVHNRLLL